MSPMKSVWLPLPPGVWARGHWDLHFTIYELCLRDKLPQLPKLLFFLWKMGFSNIPPFRELILRIKLDHTCKKITLCAVPGTEEAVST